MLLRSTIIIAFSLSGRSAIKLTIVATEFCSEPLTTAVFRTIVLIQIDCALSKSEPLLVLSNEAFRTVASSLIPKLMVLLSNSPW
jgi:hypothetical protein